ncbi:hypothetical protein F8S13_00510 [Chloroflexia bacterium SDU3-3]|nr:hypothetical protein F8S13_00510 [Chloroflexia bacterium SDU3-3]
MGWWSILHKLLKHPLFAILASALAAELIQTAYMLVRFWQGQSHLLLLFCSMAALIITLGGLAILRQRQIAEAALLVSLGLLLSIVVLLAPYGISHGSIVLSILTTPLIVATLYADRGGVILIMVFTAAAVLALFFFEQLGLFLAKDRPQDIPILNLCVVLIFLGMLSWLMYDHFRTFRLSQETGVKQSPNVQTEELRRALDEARTMRAQAEKGDSAKSAFIAAISHELRTPLHAIIAMTKYIPQDGDVNEEQRAHIARILANAGVLLRLINDVLDISKIDAGKMELYKRTILPHELSELLYSVVEDGRILAAKKNLAIFSNIPIDLPQIAADMNRLRQILTNLLSNAVKFTEAGEIELSAHIGPGGMLMIEVRDTGLGIAEPDLAIIFAPFGQAKQALIQGGTGLGLPISQKLAELHGGAITVESQLGSGSTFTLSLPIVHGARVLEEKADVSR